MLKRLLRRPRRSVNHADADADGRPDIQAPNAEYAARIEVEKDIYADQEVIHDLPPIFSYWSNKHLLPLFDAVGVSSIENFFIDALADGHRDRTHEGTSRFVSIGAGNCDAEIDIAVGLLARGVEDFVIECLEINPVMLERGAEAARSRGVGDHVVGVEADFNAWSPGPDEYDGAIANQALHHVVNLEGLYDALYGGLRPEARFAVSDMIGRNGHQRWPEARAIVEEFWTELPERHRYHRLLQRQETEFLDWDCSQEGFEGVRSQDVLPLMVARFGFERFLGFANVIDPFVDRGFGPNFDADGEWDQAFIDRVNARDVEGLLSGELKPTHVIASARLHDVPNGPAIWDRMTPEFAVRPPG